MKNKLYITYLVTYLFLVVIIFIPTHVLRAHDTDVNKGATSSFFHKITDWFEVVWSGSGVNGGNATAAVIGSQFQQQTTSSARDISDASKAQLQMLNSLLTSPKTSSTDKITQSVGSTLSGNQLSQVEASLALKRQVIMKDLAKKNPQQFLMYAMSDSQRKALSPAAQSRVEQKVSTTCALEVLHIDDFTNRDNSKFQYSCLIGSKRYEVLSPQKLAGRRSGAVKVSAWVIDSLMVLDRGESSITQTPTRITQSTTPLVPSAQQGTEALGNQRVLALIVEMQGQTSPVSVSEVEQVLFASSSPFQTYYRENSYGKMYFSGKAYKIRLNRPLGEGCNSGVVTEDADVVQAIQLQNIDLAQYDRVLFIPPVGYCSGVGKTGNVVGGNTYQLSQSWVGWGALRYSLERNYLDRTLAHEIGHALGVMHANFLFCGQTDVCEHQEYGNQYDVMGLSDRDNGYFNALYKEQLGWLAPNDFVNITTTGNYSMNALESSVGKKAAKIVNPLIGPLSVIYLEKRTKDGGSEGGAKNDGLLLNIPQSPSGLTTSHVELIDMNPGFPSWGGDFYNGVQGDQRDVVLRQGKKFELTSIGATIGFVNSVATTTVNFDINLHAPVCNHKKPIVRLYEEGHFNTSAGGNIYVGGSVYNQDPVCASPSTYTLEFPNLPTDWVVDARRPNNTAVNVSPKTEVYLLATIIVPRNTPSQDYNFISRLSTSDGLQVDTNSTVTVFPTPQIISITPANPKIGDRVVIQTNYRAIPGNKAIPYASISITGDYNYSIGGYNYANIFGGVIDSSGVINTTIPIQLDDRNSWCNTDPCVSRPFVSGQYNATLYLLNSESDPYPITITSTSTPIVTILSPNGGVRLNSSLSYQVTWTSNATSSIPTVNIYLVSMSTSSPSRVLLTPIGRTPNDGSENITIPRDTPAGQYKIEVGGPVNVTNKYISDLSDWPLDIVPVTVITPASQFHPMDTNRDRRIIISEVSAYAARFGNTAETRIGGEIWKRGEYYSYDTTLGRWKDSGSTIVSDPGVTITRISAPIYQGRNLIIDGHGFTNTSKVLIDGIYYSAINSSLVISTTSISFVVPATFGPSCTGYSGRCSADVPPGGYPSSLGSHTIAVKNGISDPVSNQVSFEVRSLTPVVATSSVQLSTTTQVVFTPTPTTTVVTRVVVPVVPTTTPSIIILPTNPPVLVTPPPSPVLVTPLATTSIPVTPIATTTTPRPISLLTASLASATDNKAGMWNVFGPGAGNPNGGSRGDNHDFIWNASLTVGESKTIKSIDMRHNANGEYWSTLNSSAYPLVVFVNGAQVNTAIGQTIGTYSGTANLTIYGQFETPTFSGGTLLITFTDGTSVSASVPASSYSPKTPAQTSSAIDSFYSAVKSMFSR